MEYKKNIHLEEKDVVDLFSSVKWRSQQFPADLVAGLHNSDCVFTAWEDNCLVGLINALTDGYMILYIHFLLVRPEYQGRGIGTQLLNLVLEEYKQIHTKILVSYNRKVKFYKRAGFEKAGFAKPMLLTDIPEMGE
jgi:GNAT superfamily N-acetyltransferase